MRVVWMVHIVFIEHASLHRLANIYMLPIYIYHHDATSRSLRLPLVVYLLRYVKVIRLDRGRRCNIILRCYILETIFIMPFINNG